MISPKVMRFLLIAANLFLINKISTVSGNILNYSRPVTLSPIQPNSRLNPNSTNSGSTSLAPCLTIDEFGGPYRKNITTRAGITNTYYRWETLNIVLDPNMESWEIDALIETYYQIQPLIPCIPIVYYSSYDDLPADYVQIVKGYNNGCSSWVGRQGGKQIMNLESPSCMNVGTMTHEFLHALGFDHEHCRHDRDDYVWIYWNNMLPGREYNFYKRSADEYTTYGVPYNFKSIMHYPEFLYSKNSMSTIRPKWGNEIGSTGELQSTDIQKLKAMYPC